MLVALAVYFAAAHLTRTVRELSQTEFVEKVQSNLVGKVQVSYPPEPPYGLQQVRGTFYETDSSGQFLMENGTRKQLRFHAAIRISEDFQMQLATNANCSVSTLNPALQKLKGLLSQGR